MGMMDHGFRSFEVTTHGATLGWGKAVVAGINLVFSSVFFLFKAFAERDF